MAYSRTFSVNLPLLSLLFLPYNPYFFTTFSKSLSLLFCSRALESLHSNTVPGPGSVGRESALNGSDPEFHTYVWLILSLIFGHENIFSDLKEKWLSVTGKESGH